MRTVESPLHSTLILRYPFKMVISLIEITSSCDCILLLLIKELQIHVEIVYGIEC